MNPPDIEAAHIDPPIDVNPPTTEEIIMAIRQIKSGKAAGPDNIPAEALKSDIEDSNPITLDGETLEDVESFTYLGRIIDEQGGSDADVNARIGKARVAFLQLKNIWNSKQLSSRRKGEDRQSKGRIPTIEEHMELKTTFNQCQSQSLQYELQDSQFYCTELQHEEL
ncbi:unnamed protein product [Schistosoma mattheei]|uniref:Uncharacterized protein n=1 Tax=Schistosoma mattheei TaxID=31246 RepID=A0A183PJ31_9TREM|nr:unnamed protein product [Schistosoma mattheei]